jgi:dihydroxyacetone kinase
VERTIVEAEAGQVSAELVRRGIAADAWVHVLVEVRDAEELSTAAIAQAGGAFDWLAGEPELYSDADLEERAG